jgi:hypothetical protein
MPNVRQRTRDNRRKTMKKLIAMSAALALLGGVTVASAQSPSTPGAGSAGQDQRGADKAGSVKQAPAEKSEKDAPPSTATTGAGPSGAAKAPSMSDKNSIHQSAGDRDSRDFPKK